MMTFDELIDFANKFIDELNRDDIDGIFIAGNPILSEIIPEKYICKSLGGNKFGSGTYNGRTYMFYLTDELKDNEVRILPIPKYKIEYKPYKLMED